VAAAEARVRRNPRIAPLRRRRAPWRWPRRLGGVSPAAFWFFTFALLSGGYSALAPAVDDWWSGLRPMTRDCRVVRVVDGDTVELGCAGRGRMRARIVGYDAPELYSPMCAGERAAAERARAALAARVRGAEEVEVAFRGRDRYGRWLVDMRLGGERVARAMVAGGDGRRYFGRLRGGWCG
jgi:endonuclease YncB( thermonuclease family)